MHWPRAGRDYPAQTENYATADRLFSLRLSPHGRSARRMPTRGSRYRKPQIVAQCRTGIVLLEQAATLQLRHQQSHDVVIRPRHVRCRQDEPVAGWCRKPFLHLIGNLLWAAAKHRMLLDRAATGDGDEIAHCRVLFAGVPDHPVAEALKGQFGQLSVAERLIERLYREVII